MEVPTFTKGINPKVNVPARLEFELINNDVAVQHVSHYATGILPGMTQKRKR